MSAAPPITAAGVVCIRGEEVLLIRRATPPRQGEWSIPGGRAQVGETIRETALRELLEETGVHAEIVGLIDVVDAEHPGDDGEPDRQYVLVDFAAVWISGEPIAGDDADAAEFVSEDVAAGRLSWSETRRVIAEGLAIVRGAR